MAKEDKENKLWAKLGKLAIDIDLASNHIAGLRKQYAEVYKSTQIEKTRKKPSVKEPKK